MDEISERILEVYQETILEKKSVPDKHQEKICKDTVKNPAKSMLGGPSAKEAEKTLRDKFGYTDKQIKKLKESVDEASAVKNVFGGYHLKDDILAGITVEDLETALYSNIPKEKLNAKTVKKEFDNMVKSNMRDATHVLSKVAKELVDNLKKTE